MYTTIYDSQASSTTKEINAVRRPSRRKRWMKKVRLGGVLVLVGTGAQQAELIDISPSHTLQMATLPSAPGGDSAVVSAEGLVITPAEADAEARTAPSIVNRLADFSPEQYASQTGTVLQTGEASYYGKGFAGRPTANGEIFDPQGMTAAHKTLPLGSIIRVTNTHNGESVVLRVNDRGPYAKDRVLDVSHSAAKVLDMEHRGTAEVRIEVL